jgi:Zn-finger nucleic acid-binding protein
MQLAPNRPRPKPQSEEDLRCRRIEYFHFMAHCSNCGGPITIADQPVKCPFCDAMNAPAPKEVMVPVPVQVVTNIITQSTESLVERRCPHCKKRLVTVVAGLVNHEARPPEGPPDGVSLSGCGGCGGIWIDNASARKVLSNPESVFEDLARRCAAGATGSRGKVEKPTCAECPAILDRSSVHGIDLDTCAEHGTWFDSRELETLVKILRHEPIDAPQQNTIECQECHQPLAANRANVTDRGLLCDSCWRAETRELIATAEATNTENGMVVSGALLGIAAVMLGAAGASRS